ncbi:AAA domain-containing protein [Melanogaster broomeanus]|nr:AAA domain-containing protein [Melanogaster broomeanus]
MTDYQPPLAELYVIGPSSTGKTTLCNAVARSMKLPAWCYITEVARQVMRTQGYTRADVGTMEMQKAIMMAQLEKETQACLRAGRTNKSLILSDRSGIDPIVYAVLTAKDELEARHKKSVLVGEPTFQRALHRYRKARFLLLNAVPEWLVDDGVRSLEQHERCIVVFREVLTELGISFYEMGGEMKDLSERVEWVKEILTDPASPRL